MYLVVLKSYVKGHHRALPDGRHVYIQPYFTKKIPKGDPAKAPRRRKAVEAPAKPLPKHETTPERLALRILAHVQSGRLSHEEAEANLAHLETRAHAGHGLDHGQGHTWQAEDVHKFIGHARTALAGHKQQEKRQKKKVMVVTKKKAEVKPETKAEEKPAAQAEDRPTIKGIPEVGNVNRVITASNEVAKQLGRRDIETRFAVVEAQDLIHSLDPRYPQELQPRLRAAGRGGRPGHRADGQSHAGEHGF